MAGSAWTNQPIVAALVIIESDVSGTGLFVYSGKPAHGNLIASITAGLSPGTDPFGNTYEPGIVSYNDGGSGAYLQMFDNVLAGALTTDAAAAQLGLGDGTATLTAGLKNVGDTTATLTLLDSSWQASGPLAKFSSAVMAPVLSLIAGLSGGQLLTVQNQTSTPTEPAVQVIAAAAGDNAVGVEVSGDTDNRLKIDSNGKLFWGPGGNTGQDTNLYREAANVLQTDDAFVSNTSVTVNGSSATGDVLVISNATSSASTPAIQETLKAAGDAAVGIEVSGDADNRFKIDSDGLMQWGSGSAGQDTTLYRAAATQLAASPIATDVSGSAETWHAISFASSGLTGTLRCKLVPLANFMIIDGSIAVTLGASAATYTFGNLPSSGYYPNAGRQYPVALTNTPSGITANMPRVFVPSSGAVQLVVPSGSGAATASFTQIVPLD